MRLMFHYANLEIFQAIPYCKVKITVIIHQQARCRHTAHLFEFFELNPVQCISDHSSGGGAAYDVLACHCQL